MKAVGILAVRIRIVEVEDSIIYGAAIGLGFAATENIIYFAAAITESGVLGLAGTAIVRSLTSTLSISGLPGSRDMAWGTTMPGIRKAPMPGGGSICSPPWYSMQFSPFCLTPAHLILI